jgi:FAD/FMN-containing dehydrogenase
MALPDGVVRRGDPDYAAAARSRFHNPAVEWNPDAVVRCASAGDVQAAVEYAAREGLRVAVRGGGVGWLGADPGTLLLDLAELGDVELDEPAQTARVGGGAIWLDVHRRLAPSGLAAAGPQFPRLGVAGYALGGGHGWLSCKRGWGCDTLVSVELVTADGRLVRASEDENADLFWALRGAGANFGVAVSLEFSLLPLETVHAGFVWAHPDATADFLAFYRDWVAVLPDDVSTIVGVNPRDGRPSAHVILCHCGDAKQAEHDLAPLRQNAGVIEDTVTELPWPQLAAGNDVFETGLNRISHMRYLNGLSDEAIDVTVEHCRDMDPLAMMGTHYYGGAMRRVPEDATAMSHRDQAWNYMVAATWPEGNDGSEARRWQDNYLRALDPLSNDAVYVNYLCQEPERVPKAYNPRTWERLRALKREWDPDNLFAQNNNIPPAE